MNSIVYCTQEFECDVGGDQQRSRGQNLLPESVLEKKSGHVTPHGTTTHVWLPGLVCASSEPWLMTRCCVYTFRWAERQKTSVFEWNKNPSREVCGEKKKIFQMIKIWVSWNDFASSKTPVLLESSSDSRFCQKIWNFPMDILSSGRFVVIFPADIIYQSRSVDLLE